MTGAGMLRRHVPATVVAHAVFGVAVLGLAASGLLLVTGGPRFLVSLLGGHDVLAVWHRRLGLAVTASLLAAPLLAPHSIAGLAKDVLSYRRTDIGWAQAIVRFVMHPHRNRPPYHDGRFDPAQRLLFAVMGALLVLLAATGVALLVAPRNASGLLSLTLRVHELSGWVFFFAAGAHVLAGSGWLPSHRGVVRAMVDGQVSMATAKRLWPGWAALQATSRER